MASVVAHTFILSTQETDLFQFEANLADKLSFRPLRAQSMQGDDGG